MSISSELFDYLPDGKRVDLFTLDNERGLTVKISTRGGAVVELLAPDRRGGRDNLVLGYDSLDDYRSRRGYFGALVGRYANRIGGGRFVLDGVEYRLACNEKGINHLHGGERGFDRAVWTGAVRDDGPEPELELSHLSPDGDQGYPGNLSLTVTYSLSADQALHIRYRAKVDRPCPLNLTNHSYFNLAGAGSGDVLGHEIMLRAESFTPCDEKLVPTGEIRPVAGTPLDFTRPAPIGLRIGDDYEQLQKARGYDHNFVLSGEPGPGGQRLAARVYEPESGRVLEVLTTQPGVQFYSGNSIADGIGGTGRQGLSPALGLLPGNPAFPGFAQPARVSRRHTAPRRGIHAAHHLPL